MIDPFDNPRRSLRRARHHLGNLGEKHNAFVEHKPWAYVVEKDIDGVGHVHKIKFSARLDDDCTSVVFDAAQNLRAALDQMAYGIAVRHTGSLKPKSCKFPFSSDPAEFANNVKGGCKDLPPEISSLFVVFKPYKGGNDVLWAVNELANSKHFTLVPVQISGDVGVFEIDRTVGALQYLTPMYDPVNNEIPLFKTAPGTQYRYDVQPSFAIALDHPEKVLSGKHPIFLLDAMSREVERALMATEAECRRIGLIA